MLARIYTYIFVRVNDIFVCQAAVRLNLEH